MNCRETEDSALQQKISIALRDIGREDIAAPPGFTDLVMSKLQQEQEEPRRKLLRLPSFWRQAVAAAAAVLIFAGSTAALNSGLEVNIFNKPGGNTEPQILTTANTGNNTFSPDQGLGGDQTNTGNVTNTNTPGSEEPVAGTLTEEQNPPPATVSAAENAGSGSNTAANNSSGSDNGVISSTGINTPVATPQPRALLSKGSKTASSTLLKISAGDLNTGKAKAMTLASGSGAETQVFPEQFDGKRIVMLKLTVPAGEAAGLLSGLKGIGEVMDSQDERRDLTARYNETIVQYNDLQTRMTATNSQDERQQLEAQAASYEQQFKAWDEETGKQTITLWLEGQ